MSIESSRMPRLITAAEVLVERTALRQELGFVPHGTGSGWSSMFWISCDCPNCRDQYDPTGEESAKYLNMDYTSFFCDQSEIPSFAFSKVAKESYWFNAEPGFYFDTDIRVRTLSQVLSELTPPITLFPKHILYIGKGRVIHRFFLDTDETKWTRRSWKNGYSVWDSADETRFITRDVENEALREILFSLFSRSASE
jgi:hypothetical protein